MQLLAIDAGGHLTNGKAYSNSTITWSTARLSPALAGVALTVAALGARRIFSIFIASMTATGWPGSTLSPIATSSFVRSPGMGASNRRDRSGGGLSIIYFDRSATCGEKTLT